LNEGQNPRAIESAGLQAGMPMGPLEVGDMVGLNLALHISEQTERDLKAEGKKYEWSPGELLLPRMVTELNRPGKGAGKGFYDYEDDRKRLWSGTYRLVEPAAEKLEQSEMIERLLFAQALETVRCRDEGVVESVADANIGSIFGWGFAPFTGGTLQYINAYGVAAFVERSRKLAAAYGPRFEPPVSLAAMADQGETFS